MRVSKYMKTIGIVRQFEREEGRHEKAQFSKEGMRTSKGLKATMQTQPSKKGVKSKMQPSMEGVNCKEKKKCSLGAR